MRTLRRTLAAGLALPLLMAGSHLLAQQTGYGYGSYPQSAAPQPAYPQSYPQQPGYPQSGYPAPNAEPDQAPPPPDYPPQAEGAQPSYSEPGPDEGAGPDQQYPQEQGYPQQGYPQEQGYPQQPGYGEPQPGSAPQALGPEQLEQLVAPIALYPDRLVAQVLAASTYPMQVEEADHWRQSMGNAPPEEIAQGANVQPWDPSVKALTAFPQVLAEMDQNLSWTTELGNAYYNQPQDLLTAVQMMRQRAEAAGTLESNPQETVTDNQGYIELAPANPQIVYVPAYNPWAVYGAPVAPYPGFSLLGALGSFFGSTPLQYGLGMVMSAFTPMSWGWLGWGLSWLAHALLFHQEGYYSHSPTLVDWGLPHGGPRAYWGRNEMARGFDRGGGYGRGREGYAGRGGVYDRAGNGAYGRGSFNGRGEAYGRSDPYGRSGFGGRPAEGYAASRGIEGVRGAYRYTGEAGRNMQAWNRAPAFSGRANEGRIAGGYGSGFYGRAGQSDNRQGYSAQAYGRQGYAQSYGRSQTMSRNYGNAWRQPQERNSFRQSAPTYRAFNGGYGGSAFGRSGFAGRPSGNFGGYSGKAMRSSGGFRGFGGGHAEKGFSGGGHFGGGHASFGGGRHSGGGGGHFSSHGGGHGHRR